MADAGDPKDGKAAPEQTGATAPAIPEIRNAGPDEMRDKPVRPWDRTDEASDESFPASDPPAIP